MGGMSATPRPLTNKIRLLGQVPKGPPGEGEPGGGGVWGLFHPYTHTKTPLLTLTNSAIEYNYQL